MKLLKRISIGIGVAVGTVMLAIPFMRESSVLRKDVPIINGERYIVVVIPSYNNSKWYEKNLSTLFAQNYTNYHVIYIDDCSQDNTAELVKQYIAKRKQSHRVTLICNTERKGALSNLYHAIHSCPDRAIVITFDGDDWFPMGSSDILQTINQAYADSHVWLTYGQFKTFPGDHWGICHPMPEYIVQNKSYRKEEWFTSHMRTFYAGLFKQVKEEDLKVIGSENEFYSVAWDQAFMFPMLEMAAGHIKFIEKNMYIYNQANPLNDFRQHCRKQLYYEREIRRKECYPVLAMEKAKELFLIS